LLGIDPFLDIPFRSYYSFQDDSQIKLLGTISTPNRIILSRNLANKNDLNIGDQLEISFQGKKSFVEIAGLVESDDPVNDSALQGLLITDISTAQELLNKQDILDRIEIIEVDKTKIDALEKIIPPGLSIRNTSEQNAQIANLSSAFQLNLTALSLLALVVGLFLIFNTMTFSVLQRRELIGVLRSLGFHRSEIFIMIIFEAAIIALIGTTLGIFSGIFLGKQTVGLILQTINDLYYVITVKSVGLPLISIVKGAILGIFATIIVAIPSAYAATTVTPRFSTLRSNLEFTTRVTIRKLFFVAIVFFIFGAILLLPIFSNLWIAFAATFLIVLGFSLLAAVALNKLLPYLSIYLKKWFGLFPGMAARELYRSLSRTSIAIASLMVAVSVTMGMTIMIDSFRFTVNAWLNETLTGDIYVSVADQFTNRSTAKIDAEILSIIDTYPQVHRLESLFTTFAQTDLGEVQINVISNDNIGYERFFANQIIPDEDIWSNLQLNQILISEPLANQNKLKAGQSITITSPVGAEQFKIIAVFYDYASSQGHMIMSESTYERLWTTNGVTALSIVVDDQVEVKKAVKDLQFLVSKADQSVIIRDNQTLRNDALTVFDRTFAITNALRFIATLVSVIGILSAVLLIVIERKKEFGILKALGVDPVNLWRLILTETGLMGLFAGLFAIPTGVVISLILVYVINLRSFGWTIQFNFNWLAVTQTLIIAIISAGFAGIYPVYRITRMKTIEVLRNE
jgi:putative ABC transport system permease protein